MTRDAIAFPDDENGDTLWRMVGEGDDLSMPREVDFAVIFPTEDSALSFAVHLLKNDLKVSFSPYDEHDELPWQVLVHPLMEPTHENISGFEGLLAEAASELGGHNDGWGCESQGSSA